MIARTIQAVSVGTVAVLFATGGQVLDEHTQIKLGSALAVAGVVGPAVWWLGSWFRGFRDELKLIKSQLQALKQQVDDLPCPGKRKECK